jgi:DNA-damage-inducible protein J
MAQSTLTIRMDSDDKKNMETLCKELGINLTTACIMFTKQALREQAIPFKVSADPFYSITNINHLKRGIKAYNAGEFKERDLIEVD